MGIADRKEREKGALRERILDAALELVSSEGLDALTMRRIADRIEYSATALYAHFADKDALLLALCRREFMGLAQMMGGFEPPNDALEGLRVVGRVYCQFALEHPQAYRLMFLLEGTPPRPHDGVGVGVGVGGGVGVDFGGCGIDGDLDAYGICVAFVTRARAAGQLRASLDSDELIAQTLWAGLHGVLALQIMKHDKGIPWRPIHDRIEAALDVLIEGIRKR